MVKSTVKMVSLNQETNEVSYNRGKHPIVVPGEALGVSNPDDLQAFIQHHGSIAKACKVILKFRDDIRKNAKLFKEYKLCIMNGEEVVSEFCWPVIGRSSIYFGVDTPVGEFWMPLDHNTYSKEQVVVKYVQAFIGWLNHCYKGDANYFVEVKHRADESKLEQKVSTYAFNYIRNEWDEVNKIWVEKGRFTREAKMPNSLVRNVNGVSAVPFWVAKHHLSKGGFESLITFRKMKIDELIALVKNSG